MKYTMLSLLLSIVGLVMLITLNHVIALEVNLRGLSENGAILALGLGTIDNANRVVLLIIASASIMLAIKAIRIKIKWAYISLVLALLLIIGVFLPVWKLMV